MGTSADRDKKILMYRIQGKSWEWIGEELGLSPKNCKNHISWLLWHIGDKVRLDNDKRRWRDYKKDEKKRLKEEIAKARKEFNAGSRIIKASMDKLPLLF